MKRVALILLVFAGGIASATPSPTKVGDLQASGSITAAKVVTGHLFNLQGFPIVAPVGPTLNNYDAWAGGPHTQYVEIDLTNVASGDLTITGIVAGNDGDELLLWCGGGGAVGTPDTCTYANNSPSSVALNRIWLASGTSIHIANNDGLRLHYIGGFGWVSVGNTGTVVRAQQFSLDRVCVPPALAAGTYANWDPFTSCAGDDESTSYVRQDVTGSGTATLNGIKSPTGINREGRELLIQNTSAAGSIAIGNNVGATVVLTQTGGTITLKPKQSVLLHYDNAAFVYRVTSYTGTDGYGSVTSIATTAPITGGPITSTGTIGINLGTGVTTSGSNLIADLGNGLTLSGNHITLNNGTGLTLVGAAETLNINAGVTQTCTGGQAVTAVTGVGLTTCATFYDTLSTGLTNGVNSHTAKLADTAVTPGSYTLSGFTVDQQGRLTAASSYGGSGSAADKAITALSAAGAATFQYFYDSPGTGLAVGATGNIVKLADTAVTPASYTLASITVDQQGRITSASSGTATTGTLIGHQVITATGTYTPTSGTKRVRIELEAGGGGGGGCPTTSSTSCAGGGGASGTYFTKWIDPSATITGGAATIGAAGSVGANAAGGAGGDTSLVVQGTTYVAKGGAGGAIGTSTATLGTMSAGGGFTTGSSAGDVVTTQTPGGYGVVYSATLAASGAGGTSPFGAGGPPQVSGINTNGNAAHGNGGGGGGVVVLGTNGSTTTGGAPTLGLIVVWEYN